MGSNISSKKIWLVLMLLTLMMLFPLSAMAVEAEQNASNNIQGEELPVEPVGDITVTTIETKTADGLIVEETSVPEAQLLYALSVKDNSIIQISSLNNSTEAEIMTKMESAFINLEPELNLSMYQIPYNEIDNNGLTVVSELYYKVLNNNFDLFYMAPKITTYYDSDQMVSKVVFTYVCEDNEVTGKLSEEETLEVMYTQEEYHDCLQKFIYQANIEERMSDVEKVVAIHDTLCRYVGYSAIPEIRAYTGKNMIVKKVGACQEYAEALTILLEEVGIESEVFIGYKDGKPYHAWNLVKVDGQWYHIDATWDDENGYISRWCFLMSDSSFHKSHPYEWDLQGRTADSTIYEDYFASSDNMYYAGGKWYYIGFHYYYIDGVKYSTDGIFCSNLHGDDRELLVNTGETFSEFNVLNGKIYYVLYGDDRILWRQIYSCNLDGTENKLFDTLGENNDAMVSSLDTEIGALTCKVYCHSYDHKYVDYYFVNTYPVAERITISSFTADKRMGQPVNTDILLSAAVNGGTKPVEYRFYYKNESDEQIVISDFSSSSSAVFRPEQAGYYDLYVEVKDSEGQVTISKIDDYQIVDANSELSAYYSTHVQNIGWQDYVADGAMSGTEGKGLRLEGLKIELTKKDGVGIKYTTHVQNIGWQDYVVDGELAGTSGKGLRLEAVKMELTGENADKYDIYYRVHAQNVGWMGWASNGAEAGTAGFSYRLEGIEIQIVNKGAAAPGSTVNAFQDANQKNKYTAEDYSVIPHKWDNGWYGRRDAMFIMDAGDESIALRINKNDYTDIDMVTYNVISNPVAYSMVIYTGDVKFFEAGDIYRTDRETAVVNKLKGVWSPSEIHVDGVKIVFAMTYKNGFVETVEYRLNPEQINNYGHTV
ncbi:hypothetical protein GH808_00690 [Acetobacterium fimetarium]|uniref:Transglutaminase-like domain-containing protein n=1 Tax=Acetobacterium fimetarium TaxID=52691 RepID=A0ABR6WRG6_9FIRM|nr:transglutaminase domain-containing protein [Acetobacterium fimetarium]MBC3802960.1 hypothetical protein [Acetobacterium fimetarium]